MKNMAARPSFWLLLVPGQIAQNQQDVHSVAKVPASPWMFPIDLTDTDYTFLSI